MRWMTKTLTGIAAAAGLAGVALPAAGTPPARAASAIDIANARGSGASVIAWNRELVTLLGTPGLQPATIHPTRVFAMLQAAEHDAVVGATRDGRSYLVTATVPGTARPDAAADQAAHDVLAAAYPTAGADIDHELNGQLAAIPAGRAKLRGIALGHQVARLVVAQRAGDGSAATPPPFTPGNQPGDYQPTGSRRCSPTGAT